MVKVTTSLVAATLLSVPVLAVASQEYERSFTEGDLYGRDLEDNTVLITREDLVDLFGRDFVEELEARQPFGGFGMVSKGFHALRHGFSHFRHGGGAGGEHHHHFGSIGSGGSSGGDSSQQQQPSRREFIDDLEERDPFGGFGMVSKGFHALRHGFSHFHHGGGAGGEHHHHFGSFGSGGSSGGDSSQQQQPSRRDLEPEGLYSREYIGDLEERDPFGGFGMVSKGFHALRHGFSHFHHGGGAGGEHHHHFGSFGSGGSSGGDSSQQQQPSRRDLEPEDLYSREYIDDLEEREPFGGFGMVSKGFHALRHGFSHFRHGGGAGGEHHHHFGSFGSGGSSGGDSSQQQQPSRRDLGYYGYYDELD